MIAADLAGLLCGVGLIQAAAAAVLVRRFAAPAATEAAADAATQPRPIPVSVLKPLHGDEPLLERSLSSVFAQDYPGFQIVFGVQHAADPALATVRRLQARFPHVDMTVVVDPTRHGANGKVSNLLNMLPAARHDVLVIADSDVHAQPDYLARLTAALAEPGTGLVTTLYAGLPATPCLAARLGATQITHIFLPGAVLARAMGRQDCLGATMVLRRATLERIGGLRSLVDHLADDQVLGRRVRALGLAVRLARTVPATTVPESTLAALWRHELRWARTIRALVPTAFAASALQYPLFWAALAVPLSGAAAWSWGVFCMAWLARALAGMVVDRALEPFLAPDDARPSRPGRGLGGNGSAESGLGLAFACPVWLLPLRDLISVAVMLASYAGRRVEWRGHAMIADTPAPVTLAPPKGPNPR